MRRKPNQRVGVEDPDRSARPDPWRLLQEQAGLVGRITTYLLSRYRLAPGESRALRRLVRARLAADDYRLLRSFNGRSSFPTYLVVVVVRLVREITAGWRVPEAPGDGVELAATEQPRAGVAVALAFLRGLPARDRILLRLRFGEQLPLSRLGAALAMHPAELRRRLGELRRALLRELTQIACEDRHTASLFAAATRLNSRPEGEPGASRPSNAVNEIDVDDAVDDSIPS